MSHLLTQALPHRSKAETAEQIRRAQAGDRAARDQVIRQHLRFLVAEVGRWTVGLPNLAEDLQAEALMGMNHAIDLFDNRRGLAFLTYAMPWMRAHIRRYLNRAPMVRGTSSELMAVTRQRLSDTLRMEGGSLNEERGLASVLHGPESQSPEALVSAAELRHQAGQDLERAMDGLTPLQVDVVRQRILTESPETLLELGRRHGLSRESIRQQEIKAMQHLRYWLKAERTG